jgi:hypothetical protein
VRDALDFEAKDVAMRRAGVRDVIAVDERNDERAERLALAELNALEHLHRRRAHREGAARNVHATLRDRTQDDDARARVVTRVLIEALRVALR